jgi:hypothetical protein
MGVLMERTKTHASFISAPDGTGIPSLFGNRILLVENMTNLAMKRILGVLLVASAWFCLNHLHRRAFSEGVSEKQIFVLRAMASQQP